MITAAQPNRDEFTGLHVRATLEPVPDGQTSLRAYIPVNAYVPLFCIMAEHAGQSLAGARGVIAPTAARSITCVINNVRIG